MEDYMIFCHICQRKTHKWQPWWDKKKYPSASEWTDPHLLGAQHQCRAKIAHYWVHYNNAPQDVQQATFDHFEHPGYDRRDPATRGRVVRLGPSAQGSAATGSAAPADVLMPQQEYIDESVSQHLDLQKLKFDEPDYLPPAKFSRLTGA